MNYTPCREPPGRKTGYYSRRKRLADRHRRPTVAAALTKQPKDCIMRNLLLIIVPAVALTALAALAQTTESTTTTTKTAVPPPTASSQTETRKSYSNEGDTATESQSQRSTT